MDINRVYEAMTGFRGAKKPWATRTGHVKPSPKPEKAGEPEYRMPTFDEAMATMGIDIDSNKVSKGDYKSYDRNLLGWLQDLVQNHDFDSVNKSIGYPAAYGNPMTGEERIRAVERGMLGPDATEQELNDQYSSYYENIVIPTLKNRRNMSLKDKFSNKYPGSRELNRYRYVKATGGTDRLGGFTSGGNYDITLNPGAKEALGNPLATAMHETGHSLNDGYMLLKGTATAPSMAPGFLAGVDAAMLKRRLEDLDRVRSDASYRDKLLEEYRGNSAIEKALASGIESTESPVYRKGDGDLMFDGSAIRPYVLGGNYFTADMEAPIPIRTLQELSINAGFKPPEGRKWTFRELLANFKSPQMRKSKMYENMMRGGKGKSIMDSYSLGIGGLMEVDSTYNWMISNFDSTDTADPEPGKFLGKAPEGVFSDALESLRQFKRNGGTKEQLIKDYNEWLDNMDKLTMYVAGNRSHVPGTRYA